jgi:hypothetical protein
LNRKGLVGFRAQFRGAPSTKFELTAVVRATVGDTLCEGSGEHGEVASGGDYRGA